MAQSHSSTNLHLHFHRPRAALHVDLAGSLALFACNNDYIEPVQPNPASGHQKHPSTPSTSPISRHPTKRYQTELLEKVKAARAEKGLHDTSASDLVANLIKEEARRLKLPPS